MGDGQATVLATIVKFDPIYAYMSVSESDLLMFRKLVREGKRVDFRKETITLDLGLPNETGFPHRGTIDYADPTVDPGSGTIQARGKFPNPGPNPTIYPGLFCRVRVPTDHDARRLARAPAVARLRPGRLVSAGGGLRQQGRAALRDPGRDRRIAQGDRRELASRTTW